MQIDFSIVAEGLAKTYGDAECIVNIERNRRYSFREYHHLTNRIVNMMRSRLALGRGDTWLCILHNDSLSLLCQFTALKGEACACYTNTTDSLEVQSYQLDLVKPKVVFIEAELLKTHYALLKQRGLTVVSMDPPSGEYPDVLDFWTLLDGVSDSNPNVVHDDRQDCLYLRFSGGTTGMPKAVMYGVDNWLSIKDVHYSMEDDIPVRTARILHFGMVSHASGYVLPPIMFQGGCNITMNDRSLETWCRVVESEKITHGFLAPPMLYRLLEAPEARGKDLTSLQTIYYGTSAMIPAKLKQAIARFGNIFFQIYGSSEHGAGATSLSKVEHLSQAYGNENHLGSAGRIVPGVELIVVDRAGKPVPDGQDGEIWIRSRAICLGYLHAPDKTASEFCNGYWKSGDFGRIDANGFVYVLDRVKDTVVNNHCNIYPSLVEAAICAHPKVYMAAVVGIEDSACGEHGHAEVVLRDGEILDVEELRVFIASRLSANEMPRTIHLALALPISGVGKVLRREVRESARKKFSKA